MASAPLNIVHIFRAPVGGLFRHVVDLARGQAARGHRVGLIADSITGGTRAEQALAALAPQLALGLKRIPMPRQPGPLDVPALWRVSQYLRAMNADVAHGHGAKGGFYARLARTGRPMVRAMTPHGGSLHFGNDTIGGRIVVATERFLMPFGNLYLFESRYSRDLFHAKIGTPRSLASVVHNGVAGDEFAPVTPAPDATDLIYLGEFRALKGVDLLIDALAELHAGGRHATAMLVGDGPDRDAIRAKIETHALAAAVRLRPPMPAREAFALGHVMVVPSRAESLPYVVLEAAAAGKPLIATDVGGIGEIFGPDSGALVRPNDSRALAQAIAIALGNPGAAGARARALRDRVAAGFSVDTMVEGVLDAYGRVLAEIRR